MEQAEAVSRRGNSVDKGMEARTFGECGWWVVIGLHDVKKGVEASEGQEVDHRDLLSHVRVETISCGQWEPMEGFREVALNWG